ncbi:MAG TPA: hypothetical protein VG125_16570 [Pirellulales bacterium]|jgi:hypothetical protein|nr:hypothetical protein [Pirellulales bacterium]
MSLPASDAAGGLSPSLAARIDDLERETAALTAALAHAQRTRLAITLLLLAFVGIAITAFYLQARHLTEEKYLAQLRTVAEKSLMDHQKQYLGQLETLAKEAGPALRDAFQAQAKRDFPTYLNKVGAERDQLVNNLKERLDKKLAERFQQSLDQHEALLKAEFPLADKPELHERMMNNVGVAMERLSQKYYADELNREMFALYDAWDAFPPAPKPLPGEISLEDQLIGTLLEVLTERLKATERVASNTTN